MYVYIIAIKFPDVAHVCSTGRNKVDAMGHNLIKLTGLMLVTHRNENLVHPVGSVYFLGGTPLS